ncbi:MAG: protein translocase subunit SecF, partial [Thermodesulfobacteriota bacterium]
GPNWGIEFTGGTEMHLKLEKHVDIDVIKKDLKSNGFSSESVQQFGLAGDNEYLVSFSPEFVSFDQVKGFKNKLEDIIEKSPNFKGASILRIDYIGPKVGKQLISKALLAILFGCVGILIYLVFRFEFGFAMGAVIALIHDFTITLGAISILDKEFSLAIIAALLTVIGYSVNDTIIIFDRIRESIGNNPGKNFRQIVNDGINQTLSRTILTSFTVFIVLIPLFLLGGATIHDFAFTLIIGVIVGTYSSIFIAGSFVIYWRERKKPK